MKYILITNNDSLLNSSYKNINVVYKNCSYIEVLLRVRAYIHKGHTILTHPLSSSLKPNETPFKSILISGSSKGATDAFSVDIIEQAIEAYKKFPQSNKSLNQKIIDDFKLVDKTVIESAILNNL
ncbi:MAG: GrdX protein [Christensenellaceae bacterium]|nr:GrdX protein [Christensenellaceae bacterium]